MSLRACREEPCLQASYRLTCKYLVAADGAGSRVRAALGIPMAGEPALQHLVNVHFWAPALGRRLVRERPAMLYFVFNPRAVVVVVAHDLGEGDFVAQVSELCTLTDEGWSCCEQRLEPHVRSGCTVPCRYATRRGLAHLERSEHCTSGTSGPGGLCLSLQSCSGHVHMAHALPGTW